MNSKKSNDKLVEALEEYILLFQGGCTKEMFLSFLSRTKKSGVNLEKLLARIRLHGHSPSFVKLPSGNGPIEITSGIQELTCRQALEFIDKMNEEVLTENGFVGLAVHLDNCPSCERLYQNLQKLR